MNRARTEAAYPHLGQYIIAGIGGFERLSTFQSTKLVYLNANAA
ncbi:hypothetical protein OAC63_03600 [Amylibacter sp.]|jgi:hypothetical protein|nr:hypothetical protein [Amylibacter sp.]